MRSKDLKPATVHQVHRTLRTALNEALRRGQIVKNPALVAKAPLLVEEETDPFTVVEVRRILESPQRIETASGSLSLSPSASAKGKPWASSGPT